MIDTKDMQEAALLGWVSRLQRDKGQLTWTNIPQYQYGQLGTGMSVFSSNNKPKDMQGLSSIKSKFWKMVLTTWLSHTEVKQLNDISDEIIPSQIIWNNHLVKYQNKSLFMPKWIKANILYIQDIIIDNRLITFEQLCRKMEITASIWLEYFTVINAIPQPWRNTQVNGDNHVDIVTFKEKDIQAWSMKDFRRELQPQNIQPKSVHFWQRKFPNVNFSEQYWCLAHHCCKEIRLKTLQWKILHNIYPTNIMLKKMGKTETENCVHCGVKDYIEHFFYQCTRVKQLWKEVQSVINAKIGQRINIDEQIVILGIIEGLDQKKQKIANILILIAKMCISKFKYGKSPNLLATWEAEIYIRGKVIDHLLQAIEKS